MKKFVELVREFECDPCICGKYSPAGKCFYSDKEYYKGNYWFYEAGDFIIDIHDLYIKKDYVIHSMPDMRPYMSLISNYLITGSGEWFTPYQNMSANTMFVMDAAVRNQNYLIHGNSRFFLVGMKFKESMIEKYMMQKLHIGRNEASQIFWETRNDIVRPIGKIAAEIVNCRMESPSAELFFEAKAREWLSITIDAYGKRRKEQKLSEEDRNSIEDVANYISDHYAFDIPQELLEKIALMSGTKLKTSFRSRYQMSITEYTQRKRMNVAENLLLTTSLDIRDIAKAVGYRSSSRFTTLFKRFKGICPKELRDFSRQNFKAGCERAREG